VTAYTTAKLTSQHSLIYNYLIRSFGEEKAFAYATANEQAIGFVAQVAATHGIECEFTRAPAYVYAEKDGEVEQLEAEAKAAQKVGLPADL
jgi:hypothetical protein